MVKWSLPAKADIREIFDYIARDSRFYAIKVVDEIIELSEKLNPHTFRGRVVPEVNHSNVREVFIYSYRLIFEVSLTDIFIIAVIHGKRILSPEEIEERRE
ncbi:MAG: type II toxin-antitoxin system RelE/ParE family toxin [bacterium]